VREVLAEGHHTRDVAIKGQAPVFTKEIGELVAGRIRQGATQTASL
jgi:hypothetical protein